MREIKFRGKSVDKGIWVYGYYLVAAGMPFISVFGKREPIPVIPETVGQYTGLKDKNGVEIYEGDILSYIDCDTKKPCKTIVGFDDGTFWNSDMYFHADMSTFEIIDNIYKEEKKKMKDVLVFSRIKFGKYARANYSEKDAKIVIKLSWGWTRKCEGLTPEEMLQLCYSYDDRWFVKKSELKIKNESMVKK